MSQVVSARLLRKEVELEPQEFVLERDAASGAFSISEDASG